LGHRLGHGDELRQRETAPGNDHRPCLDANMAVVALLDTTNGFDEVVDVKLGGLRAKTSNFNRPRLRLPSTIRELLWILFRESPFVEIVVAGDEVVGRELHAIELERGIERVGKSSRCRANRCGENGRGGDPETDHAMKVAAAKIVRLGRN